MKSNFLLHLGILWTILWGGLAEGDGQTSVRAWGGNEYAQLDAPATAGGAIAIAAGNYHSLALADAGTVVPWCGITTLPPQSPMPAGLSDIVAIEAGYWNSIALSANGGIVVWGGNFNGQLNVPAGLTDIVAVAAGTGHMMALRTNGTVITWGEWENGSGIPAPTNLTGVVAIAAGTQALALKANGTVVAWGSNTQGQAAVPSDLTDVVQIKAGRTRSYALKRNGTVVQWGEPELLPPGLTDVVAISAAHLHALALRGDGSVVAWGSNFTGESSPPMDLGPVSSIAAGTYHSVALVSTGPPAITCPKRWITEVGGLHSATSFHQRICNTGNAISYNATGLPPGLLLDAMTGLISGTAATVGTFSVNVTASNSFGTATRNVILTVFGAVEPSPVAVWGNNNAQQHSIPAGLETAVEIATGWGHGLALLRNGTVAAWGANNAGQATVPANLQGVVAIAAGQFHSLALKGDGTVVGWGTNYFGQNDVPADLTDVISIADGHTVCLAVRSNGTVVRWGGVNQEAPLEVPTGLTGVKSVALCGHALALKQDGTVVSFGRVDSGQNAVPAGLNNVVAVAVGYAHSLALKADGTVVAWGSSYGIGGVDYGQISVPIGLRNVVAIAAGDFHSMALKEDGTVIGWGYNNSGQTFPPADLSNVAALAAGSNHSMALKYTSRKLPRWNFAFLTSPVTLPYPPARFALPNYSATNLPPGLSIDASTGVITGIALQTGTWYSTIQTSNPLNSRTEQIAIYVEPLTTDYATWAAIHWPTNAAASGTNADPDHDGRTNLIEYALRTPPVDDNAVLSPVLSHDAAGHLVLDMDVADRGPDVTWTAQFTSDLHFNNAITASPFVVLGAAPGFVRLRFSDPLNVPAARRLARLRVSTP